MGSTNLTRPLCSFAISSYTVALKFSSLALLTIYHSILHWVLSFPLALLFLGVLFWVFAHLAVPLK